MQISKSNPDSSFYRSLIGFAVVLFILLTIFVSFPFIGDDYQFLGESYGPHFSLLSFNPFVERMPVTMVINFFMFKFHLWELSWSFLYLLFLGHACGYALTLRWLIQNTPSQFQTQTGEPSTGRISRRSVFLAFALLFSLDPNMYEVFYWPTATPYLLGMLIVSGGLYCRPVWLKALLFTAAMLTSEMFGAAAFCILIFPSIFASQFDGSNLRDRLFTVFRRLQPWLIGVFLYFLVRGSLMHFLPARPYHASLSVENLWGQFQFYLRMVYLTQFMRINWVSSVLELFGLTLLTFALLRDRYVSKRTLFLTFGLITLSCFYNFILVYDAPRGYYATLLLKGMLLATLARPFFLYSARKRLKIAIVVCFGLSFLIGQIVVVTVKQRNFKVLQKQERMLSDRILACAEPCQLIIGSIGAEIKGDWVLPDYMDNTYVEWVKARVAPHKQIMFRYEPAKP